jgi:hypothetical protein
MLERLFWGGAGHYNAHSLTDHRRSTSAFAALAQGCCDRVATTFPRRNNRGSAMSFCARYRPRIGRMVSPASRTVVTASMSERPIVLPPIGLVAWEAVERAERMRKGADDLELWQADRCVARIKTAVTARPHAHAYARPAAVNSGDPMG